MIVYKLLKFGKYWGPGIMLRLLLSLSVFQVFGLHWRLVPSFLYHVAAASGLSSPWRTCNAFLVALSSEQLNLGGEVVKSFAVYANMSLEYVSVNHLSTMSSVRGGDLLLWLFCKILPVGPSQREEVTLKPSSMWRVSWSAASFCPRSAPNHPHS